MFLARKNTELGRLFLQLLIVFFVVNILCSAIIAEEKPKYYGPKKRIAVLDFENRAPGAPWNIGKGLSEMLITALHETGMFIVLERTAIEDVFKEQGLGMSGAVRKGTEANVGEMLGAQVLIKGVITEFEEKKRGGGVLAFGKGVGLAIGVLTGYVAMDIRMFDANTGVILESHRSTAEISGTLAAGLISGIEIGIGGAGFEKTPLGKATREAIQDTIDFIVEKMEPLPWRGRVILAEEKEVYINAGSEYRIEERNYLRVFKRGKELIDPDTGLSLGAQISEIGLVKVIKVEDKFSIAQIVSGSGGEKGDIVELITEKEAEQIIRTAPPPKTEKVSPIKTAEKKEAKEAFLPKTFTIKGTWKVTVDSVEFLPGRKNLRFNLLIGNLQSKAANCIIRKYTYLLDNLGNEYRVSKISPSGERTLIQNMPIKANVVFPEIEEGAEVITLYLYFKGYDLQSRRWIGDSTSERNRGRKLAIGPIKLEETAIVKEEAKVTSLPKTLVTEDGNWEVTVDSYELKEGKIEFTLLVKNLQEKTAEATIYKSSTYLLDNLANEYHNPELSIEGYKKFVFRMPMRVYVSFPETKEAVEAVVFYLRFQPREGAIGNWAIGPVKLMGE